MDNLYIPKSIKVGYQERSDTYTGNLAFLTFQTPQGTISQEKTWKRWIHKEMGDFDNKPIEGIVLNKGVGLRGGGRNRRTSKIRVYDPRGWEIEITVENLMFILEQNNCIAGKGIEGEFVYAWSPGFRQLYLLPTKVQEYEKSQKYTALQHHEKLTLKDLIPGAGYKSTNNEDFIYLGRMRNNYFQYVGYNDNSMPADFLNGHNQHVFLNENTNQFITVKGSKDLKFIAYESIKEHPEFPFIMDFYENSLLSQMPTKFVTKERKLDDSINFDDPYNRVTLFQEVGDKYYKYIILKKEDYYEIRFSNVFFFHKGYLCGDTTYHYRNSEYLSGKFSLDEINDLGLFDLKAVSDTGVEMELVNRISSITYKKPSLA